MEDTTNSQGRLTDANYFSSYFLSFVGNRLFTFGVLVRGDFILLYGDFGGLVTVFLDGVLRVLQGFFTTGVISRVIMVGFNVRIGGICSASRNVLKASQGLGQGYVTFGSFFCRIRGVMGIYARGVRLVCVSRAKCVVFIDLTPGNFELELCTTLDAGGNGETIGRAGKALGLGDRIGITQYISGVSSVFFPRTDYYDKNSYSASFLLLYRPIRDDNTIINFASFIIGAHVVGSALNDNYFANVSVHRGAGVSYRLGQRFS